MLEDEESGGGSDRRQVEPARKRVPRAERGRETEDEEEFILDDDDSAGDDGSDSDFEVADPAYLPTLCPVPTWICRYAFPTRYTDVGYAATHSLRTVRCIAAGYAATQSLRAARYTDVGFAAPRLVTITVLPSHSRAGLLPVFCQPRDSQQQCY